MKRISVLLVLVLTLFSLAALTSCGCQASSDTKPNDQTTTPGSSTDNGTTNSGTNSGTANSGTNSGTAGNGSTSTTPGNGSLADDMIDGGESIIDGVIEGGQDVVDGVGDAITGNTDSSTSQGNSSNLPTYEDMVRNGRIR